MAWHSKRKAWLARGFGILALVLFFVGLDHIQAKASRLRARNEAIVANDEVRLSALHEEGHRNVIIALSCFAGSVAFYLARVIVGISDRRKVKC